MAWSLVVEQTDGSSRRLAEGADDLGHAIRCALRAAHKLEALAGGRARARWVRVIADDREELSVSIGHRRPPSALDAAAGHA